MTTSDLEDFFNYSNSDYAAEKIAAGTWSKEEALSNSKASFNKLLYDGITTPNEHLYSIFTDQKSVIYGSMLMKNMLSFMIL